MTRTRWLLIALAVLVVLAGLLWWTSTHNNSNIGGSFAAESAEPAPIPPEQIEDPNLTAP